MVRVCLRVFNHGVGCAWSAVLGRCIVRFRFLLHPWMWLDGVIMGLSNSHDKVYRWKVEGLQKRWLCRSRTV